MSACLHDEIMPISDSVAICVICNERLTRSWKADPPKQEHKCHHKTVFWSTDINNRLAGDGRCLDCQEVVHLRIISHEGEEG